MDLHQAVGIRERIEAGREGPLRKAAGPQRLLSLLLTQPDRQVHSILTARREQLSELDTALIERVLLERLAPPPRRSDPPVSPGSAHLRSPSPSEATAQLVLPVIVEEELKLGVLDPSDGGSVQGRACVGLLSSCGALIGRELGELVAQESIRESIEVPGRAGRGLGQRG